MLAIRKPTVDMLCCSILIMLSAQNSCIPLITTIVATLYWLIAVGADYSACLQENQDKFMLQMNREDGWTVMGVFDGHGMWGGKVASAVRDGMVRAMKEVDGRKMNGSDPEMVSPWRISAVVKFPLAQI